VAADRYIILTGAINSGKTSLLRATIRLLVKKGFHSGGFLSEGILTEQKKSGYQLLALPTNERHLLCSTTYQKDWQQIGKFFFNPHALALGNSLLNPLAARNFNPLFIDEAGPLELNGGGWAPALDTLALHETNTCILTIREGLVQQICHQFRIESPRILAVNTLTAETFTETIVSQMKSKTV
jgi:nucleoside-triphosphatase THEP1